MSTPVMSPRPAQPARVVKLPGPVTVSIYEEWDLPAGIVQAWETILEEYGDIAIFLRYGWFRESWLRIDLSGKRLAIFVIEMNGAVRGICPCWVTPSRRGKFASINPLTKGPYYDWIVAAGERVAVIAAFFEAAWRLGSPGAATVIDFLPAASANRAAIEIALQERKARFALVQRPAAPFVDLRSAPWEQYYSSLHPKFRKNLRRLRKQAEQEGALSFDIIRRPDSLETILDEMFEVEFRSWKGAQGTAMKCAPRSGRFYSAVAAWAMARGSLAIFTLRLDGRMIAFDLCVIGARTVFLLKTGFDQVAAARFSPGNLMRAQLIESLYRSGEFDRYDLLGVCDPWKLEWTPFTNTLTWMEIYPPTVAGRTLYFLRHGWKSPLKRSARLITILRWVKKRLRPERPPGRTVA
jgi:CelD/BcsL family acetyltransferase involved in cellulose biosynthesis